MNLVTDEASPQTVIESLQKNRENHTVGYGDRYRKPSTDHFTVEDTNAAGGIHHQNQSNEFGFDLTSFGCGNHAVQSFLSVLEIAGLHPIDHHYRVYRNMGRGIDASYRDRFLFVWVSSQILIVCSNNPVTGEAGGPNINASRGDAGYIGVAGETPLVDEVVEAINERAATKSEMRAGSLFY